MELNDILKALKDRSDGAKKLSGFNSRHFAFKNWHAAVMRLLRELPSPLSQDVNDFKALAFEDTGFKRGKKFLSSSGNTKYREDLDKGAAILKDIFKKANSLKGSKAPEASPSKPEKPKPAGKSSVKKRAPKKAPASGKARKPAKAGSSPSRKKKKS